MDHDLIDSTNLLNSSIFKATLKTRMQRDYQSPTTIHHGSTSCRTCRTSRDTPRNHQHVAAQKFNVTTIKSLISKVYITFPFQEYTSQIWKPGASPPTENPNTKAKTPAQPPNANSKASTPTASQPKSSPFAVLVSISHLISKSLFQTNSHRILPTRNPRTTRSRAGSLVVRQNNLMHVQSGSKCHITYPVSGDRGTE
jgi:hypothetical protein